MSADQWGVVGTIIGIILFVCAGFGFSYNGFKDWNKYDSSEDTKAKWGRFEFFLGIVFIVLAIVCIIILIYLVESDKIVKGDETETTMTTESATVEPSTSETNEVYVKNISYQGAIYSGYIDDLRRPNGEGTMKYLNGQEYTGDWVNGIQQGRGIMIYNNGNYEGEWQNGKRNGKGTYTWNDGKKYEGEYVDDVRNGYGIFSGWIDLTNGYSGTYYGESINDQFNGSGYFIFDNGDRFDGIYKNNLYWTGIYTRNDGSCYEIVNGQTK